MNIFYLDEYPTQAARYHVDKHVVKMILEYAQLLSTAHRVLDGEMKVVQKHVLGSFPPRYKNVKRWTLDDMFKNKLLYEATHINHPCAIWTRESSQNYSWLSNLLIDLCEEYTHRYDKHHKVEQSGLCFVLHKNIPKNIPNKEFTLPPRAMPDIYKTENVVESYRNYYMGDKIRFAKWKNRQRPSWFTSLNVKENAVAKTA